MELEAHIVFVLYWNKMHLAISCLEIPREICMISIHLNEQACKINAWCLFVSYEIKAVRMIMMSCLALFTRSWLLIMCQMMSTKKLLYELGGLSHT